VDSLALLVASASVSVTHVIHWLTAFLHKEGFEPPVSPHWRARVDVPSSRLCGVAILMEVRD
jgi:hypothetical protein